MSEGMETSSPPTRDSLISGNESPGSSILHLAAEVVSKGDYRYHTALLAA